MNPETERDIKAMLWAGSEASDKPEVILERIADKYPGVPVGDIMPIVDEHLLRLQDHAAHLFNEARSLEYVMKVSRRAGTDGTIGERLQLMAGAGDKQAGDLLAHFNRPVSVAWQAIMNAAVEASPDWRMADDGGGWIMSKDARMRTPEDLVAQHLIEQGDIQTLRWFEREGLVPEQPRILEVSGA